MVADFGTLGASCGAVETLELPGADAAGALGHWHVVLPHGLGISLPTKSTMRVTLDDRVSVQATVAGRAPRGPTAPDDRRFTLAGHVSLIGFGHKRLMNNEGRWYGRSIQQADRTVWR